MKYTIDQIKENKIAVYCDSTEKAQKLCKAFGGRDWCPSNSSQEYTIIYNSRSPSVKLSWVSGVSNKKWFTEQVINFSEIDFEEFPEKWSVKGGEKLEEFFNKCKENQILDTPWNGDAENKYYHYDGKNIEYSNNNHDPKYQEVTVEQLEKHYMKSEKKQIGWLIKNEFIYAVNKLTGQNFPLQPFGHFGINSIIEEDLKGMKVLDLFCEPVFENIKQPIELFIGNNNVKVIIAKDITVDKIIVNIKEFKDILSYLKEYTTYTDKLNNWDVRVAITKEQRIYKFGCTLISLGELENVLNTWREWNK